MIPFPPERLDAILTRHDIVTATLASWLVDRIAEESERSESVELRAIGELHEEIAALRREVRELREVREPREHHSGE